MLLRPRTLSLYCCSLRPILNSYRSLPSVSHLNLSSLAQTQVSGVLDDDCDGFLPWLERKAASTISSALSIGKSSYGRSLFASRIIHTGECILKVPYSVQITVDNLLPEIRSLISDEVENIAKLAVVILVEQKLGRVSEWDPYVSCLPKQGELHNMTKNSIWSLVERGGDRADREKSEALSYTSVRELHSERTVALPFLLYIRTMCNTAKAHVLENGNDIVDRRSAIF
ncbi:fructose-bisphosphate aldolase-lysine N-methyltransferase, chloroplastic isoform X1 [Senna tora]|uniref:Fructose-bisphosphate aldolase-lysine N-methyltransferase, chloroplastic isoform X1 n=1 Tax=Senna tora TaxID=362788 RepID=A0A834WBS9_9FABA|nr:fructose-bisphosphate aldolase-lysine N-methyltransferase, chloroplastic isoform X1 [Senna tora]